MYFFFFVSVIDFLKSNSLGHICFSSWIPFFPEISSTARCPLPRSGAFSHRLTHRRVSYLKTEEKNNGRFCAMFLMQILFNQWEKKKWLYRPSLVIGGSWRRFIVTDEPTCTLLAKCLGLKKAFEQIWPQSHVNPMTIMSNYIFFCN